MTLKTTPFDPAECLDSEEVIQEFFRQVMAEGDPDEIVQALGMIARARGMTKVANDTGLGRESLYKTFAEGTKPRFDTVMRIIKSLGLLKIFDESVAASH